MTISKPFLAITALLVLAGPVAADHGGTYAEAQAMASERGVPLLLDFYSDT